MQLLINGVEILINGETISINTQGNKPATTGKVGYVSNSINPPDFAYGHVARQCRAFVKATKVKSTTIEAHCAATVKAALNKLATRTRFKVEAVSQFQFRATKY